MYKIETLPELSVLSLISLALLTFFPAAAPAESEIKYLPDKVHVKNIVLENDMFRYTISLDRSVKLTSAVEKATGTDFLAGNPPLMFTAVRMSSWIDDVGYHLFTAEDSETEKGACISITQKSSYVENPLIVTQTFTLGTGPELGWSVKVLNSATGGRAYRGPQSITSRITFPLMQKIKLGSQTGMHYLIPTQGSFFCIDSPEDFIFYFTRGYDPKLPIDIYNKQLGRGIYFHVIGSSLSWDFSDKDDFVSRVAPIRETGIRRSGRSRNTSVPALILLITGGRSRKNTGSAWFLISLSSTAMTYMTPGPISSGPMDFWMKAN